MGTEFLLGGALAFLLALLGWSDQIRGVQERTRTQERELLDTYNKIRWRDVRALIRPSEGNARDRLLGALGLLKDGVLANDEDARLLTHFESLDGIRRHLENTYSMRYWLIFATTLHMLISGALSVNFRGVIWTWFSWQLVYSLPTIVLVGLILMLTMRAAINETRFRNGLNEVEDVLRAAKERRIGQGG